MNFNLKKRGFVVISPGKNTETLWYIRKYSHFQVLDEYTRKFCGSVELISINSTQGMYFFTSRVLLSKICEASVHWQVPKFQIFMEFYNSNL